MTSNSQSPDYTDLIIEAILDKKGENITVIDLADVESAPAPELIICQGRSTSQVSAIADNIRESLADKAKLKPAAYDGYRNSQWIVLDYGSIMVHIFVPEFRDLYRLEELWGDGKIENYPNNL